MEGKIDTSPSLTFIEPLMVALAQIPGDTLRLDADSDKWNEIICNLKRSLKTTAPELLQQVYFTTREPLAPHSHQLDDFFMFAGLSGTLTTQSPDYKTFELSANVKEKILRNSRLATDEAYTPALREMSEGLAVLVIPQNINLNNT